MDTRIFLAIETGGTKILGRLVKGHGMIAEGRWPTTTAEAACRAITDWVASVIGDRAVAGAGIAAFGPVIVDQKDPRYGEQLLTPKPGWAGSNLRLTLSRALQCPVLVDTDVNAAAAAELVAASERSLSSLAYVTIGTGIGGGLASGQGSLRGALHPEVGHIRVTRLPDDRAQSTCPFHSDCVEGLAAGPAIRRRLGGDVDLVVRSDILELVASYIGQLCATLALAWSPHRIVIGGGVAGTPGMIEAIRQAYRAPIGDYCIGAEAASDEFITRATLADAGLEGAILLAHAAGRR